MSDDIFAPRPSSEQDDIFAPRRSLEQDDIFAPVGAPSENAFAPEGDPLADLFTPRRRPQTPDAPDVVAKRRLTADKLGVPEDVVASAPEEARAAEEQYDFDVLRDTSPSTAEFMSDPLRAEIASDSTEALERAEAAAQKLYPRNNLSLGEVARQGFDSGVSQQRIARQRSGPFLGANQLPDVSGFEKILKDRQIPDALFARMLGATAQIIGQQAESMSGQLDNPLPFYSTATATGMGIGFLTGGPLGMLVGGAVGFGVSAAVSGVGGNFTAMATGTYAAAIDAGVSKENARAAGVATGILGSALETVGATGILYPIKVAGQKLASVAVQDLLKRKAVLAALAETGKAWSLAMAVEGSTELLQEVVAITAENVVKSLEGIETSDAAEVGERMEATLVELLYALPLLMLPGSVVRGLPELRRIQQAEQQVGAADEFSAAVVESPLSERSPEDADAHSVKVLEESGMREVGIDPEQFLGVEGLPEALEALKEQALEAAINGQDLELTAGQFAELLRTPEAYSALREHVRYAPDAFTLAETKELESPEFQDLASFESPAAPDADLEVDLAEEQLGYDGMFKTADEAGMSQGAFESYTIALTEARQESRNRQSQARLRQEKRELSEEYADEVGQEESAVRSELQEEPVYQALGELGANQFLDRSAVVELLGNQERLKDLPKSQGRNIHQSNRKGQNAQTIHPDELAQIHGFIDGKEMLQAMIDRGTLEVVSLEEAKTRVRARHPDMARQEDALNEALRSTHSDARAAVLVAELNNLQALRAHRKVNTRLVAKLAREVEESTVIRKFTSAKVFAEVGRAGKAAGKLFRKGEMEKAARAKFGQLRAFHTARKFDKTRKQIDKDLAYLKKLAKLKADKRTGINFGYLEAAKYLLTKHGYARAADGVPADFNFSAWAEGQGIGLLVSDEVLQGTFEKPTDMTVGHLRDLKDTIKAIEFQGRQVNKLMRDQKEGAVSDLIHRVETALADVKKLDPRHPGEQKKRREIARGLWLYHMQPDTIIWELDGREYQGAMYEAVKKPIDDSISNGYLEGSVGYQRRMTTTLQELSSIFDRFYSPKERAELDKPITVAGVQGPTTRGELLMVLMNSGNDGNVAALQETFFEQPGAVEAYYEAAEKRDWDFAQAVWDYHETFHPDIVDAVQRRENRRPEMVEATPVETKFGVFRGGYVPINYARFKPRASLDRAKVEFKSAIDDSNAAEAFVNMRNGKYLASHTRDGHLKDRKGGGGRRLGLDINNITTNFQTIVYDLEVGDAVRDVYKILENREFKNAMLAKGRETEIALLETWFRDATTGELAASSDFDSLLRHLRAGFTITKLGLNLGTTAVQILGLSQSAPLVGKANMVSSVFEFLHNGKNMWQNAVAESAMMAERMETIDKDIALASSMLRKGNVKGFLLKFMPKSAEYEIDAAATYGAIALFYGIKRMQFVVDSITWHAAMKQGLVKFKGDKDKALHHADQMVTATQGTGIFSSRSAIERGSVGAQQLELVRGMTTLGSYFITKMNVASRRFKETKFSSPMQILDLTADMLLLFALESVVLGLVRGVAEDKEPEEFALWVAKESISAASAGTIFSRDLAGSMRGFSAGGVYGSVIKEAGRSLSALTDSFTAAAEGDTDKALEEIIDRNIGSNLGTMLKLPSSQPMRFAQGFAKLYEGEEVPWYEWIFGPTPKN